MEGQERSLRSDPGAQCISAHMRVSAYRRSLTALDTREPSALPAANAEAAFMTSPICFIPGRSPSSSAT